MTTMTTICDTTIKNKRRGSGCDATINNARRGSGGGEGREIGGRNKRGTATDDEIGCDDEMSITMTTAPSLLRTTETVNLITNQLLPLSALVH